MAELRRALDPDAIVVVDAGTPCPYFSAYYQVHGTGRRVFSNRAHGALGYSMAAAMGAHFARPEVKCVSVMGDGSFGFTCGELETAARYRLPITFIVIANASYGWIKAGQKSAYGQRYFAVDFAVTDHAAVAAAFGVKSWRDHRTQRSRQSVKRSARRGGTDPGRYRLPAASRSKSARVGMDCVKAGNRQTSTAESFPLLCYCLVPVAYCLLQFSNRTFVPRFAQSSSVLRPAARMPWAASSSSRS